MARLEIFIVLIISTLSRSIDVSVKFFFASANGTLTEVTHTSNLDTDGEVKIYCHGWADSLLKTPRFMEMRNAYHTNGVENVIGVDWSKNAIKFYSQAIEDINTIGKSIATFITSTLEGHFNVSLSKVHLIGHSLGAHVMAYAGRYAKGVVGRITGLDPAGPKFENATDDKRLSFRDALFVDVIHTDGGTLGYERSLGHVDFYPNGGSGKQEGCAAFDFPCDHNRAPVYFIESINHNKFVSVRCQDYRHFLDGKCDGNNRAEMGEHVSRFARGDFYLKTKGHFPFALG